MQRIFFFITLLLLALTVANIVVAEELSEFNLSATDQLLFDEIPSVFSTSKHEQKVTDAPATQPPNPVRN